MADFCSEVKNNILVFNYLLHERLIADVADDNFHFRKDILDM
jgi:hypothetical protein